MYKIKGLFLTLTCLIFLTTSTLGGYQYAHAADGATDVPPKVFLNLPKQPDDKAYLDWVDKAAADYYEIYKDGYLLDTIVTNHSEYKINYTDPDIVQGEAYAYTVIAYNQFGASELSNKVWASFYTAPEIKLAEIRKDPGGNPQVVLNWSVPKGDPYYTLTIKDLKTNEFRNSPYYPSGTYTDYGAKLGDKLEYTLTINSIQSAEYAGRSATSQPLIVDVTLPKEEYSPKPSSLIRQVTSDEVVFGVYGPSGKYEVYSDNQLVAIFDKKQEDDSEQLRYREPREPGRTYTYYAKLIKDGYLDTLTDTVTHTEPAAPSKIKKAAPVIVTIYTDETMAELQWIGVPNTNIYYIYRNGQLITPVIHNTYFRDYGLDSDTPYIYQVVAGASYAEYSDSDLSDPYEVRTKAWEPLKLELVNNYAGAVKLSYTPLQGVDHYELYRDGEYKQYISRYDDPVIYDKDTKEGDTHHYELKFVSGSISPDRYSNPIDLTVGPAPFVEAPLNLTAKANSDYSIDLSWGEVDGIDDYVVYNKGNSYGSGSQTNTKIYGSPGDDFDFQVVARKDMVESLKSNSVKVKLEGFGLKIKEVGSDYAIVSWKEIGERMIIKDFRNWKVIYDGNLSEARLENLVPDTQYPMGLIKPTYGDYGPTESFQIKTTAVGDPPVIITDPTPVDPPVDPGDPAPTDPTPVDPPVVVPDPEPPVVDPAPVPNPEPEPTPAPVPVPTPIPGGDPTPDIRPTPQPDTGSSSPQPSVPIITEPIFANPADNTNKPPSGGYSPINEVPVIWQENETEPQKECGKLKYSDLDCTHFAFEAIKRLDAEGTVKGYIDGTFKPYKPITRAEFASMLARHLKLSGSAKVTQFKDLKRNAWYYKDVQSALEMGVTKGFTDGLYRPVLEIPREQASVMVSNVGHMMNMSSSIYYSFTDFNKTIEWAKKDVLYAASVEIIKGYPDGSFKPKGIITRAEAAVMIDRLAK